jgi:SAM-dependent methyltransferase
MVFSKEWNERFKSNQSLSFWPWSELVSYVMRYARPTSPSFRVLEIGCGAGANIPFFQNLQVQYFAIEGSEYIVNKLWQSFPELKNHVIIGDFTENIPFPCSFDLIVDRSAMTHNSTASIKKGLGLVYDKMHDGAKYIGIDWFSTAHSEYQQGLPADDRFTRQGYTEGHFASVGRAHFSDREHLQELFAHYVIELLEHKVISREIPPDHYTNACWNLVARKA